MSEIFWTFIHDEEVHDADYGSKNAAQAAADSWWAEETASNNDDMRNGETFEADIDLIAYTYDDDGERKMFTTIKSTVEYEHYHGDLTEHGIWG